MAPSQGYYDWIAAGKPYALIRPAAAIVSALRSHGLTVYHYPNDAHLKALVPEDHTPFSVTGWPGTNRRWNARGVDVMPRAGQAVSGIRENAEIARQLIRDRNAGHPGVMWIKYLNWTDEQGVCRQERWTPDHVTRSSTDRGHIHISGRSDADDDTRADGYDPIERMNGADMEMNTPVPDVPGLTAGVFFRDAWTHLVAERGLTLDEDGIPQRHRHDRWASPHFLAAQTEQINALHAKVDAILNALATIAAAGGSADAAAILAGVKAEIRDAVADLGEGGAAQVRADE